MWRRFKPWAVAGGVFCLLVAIGLWWHRAPAKKQRPHNAKPPIERMRTPRVPPRAPGAVAAAKPAPTAPRADPDEACAPAAKRGCFQGDVWSLDGCGALEHKLEECGAQLCKRGVCERADLTPCTEPSQGRCDGEVVRACIGGRAVTIDCAAQGRSCAEGSEGAQCTARIEPRERCRGPARCEGDRLITCEAGRAQTIDCRAQGASCLSLPGAALPRCVDIQRASELPCGPCGCSRATARREVQCDGRDEDGNGFADDGLDCGPVPLIAFVVTDADGQASHSPEDVAAELGQLNRLFASSSVEHPPQFELEAIEWLEDPALLEIDDQELGALADATRVHPARQAFYIPVLFTDRVLVDGGVPKLGASTLPNGTCGKMQLSAGPEVGLVVVAKTRAPTTLAHELGHFLGLCHTQDQWTGPPLLAQLDAFGGAPRICGRSCLGEGDGLCDTPLDPGPERCSYDRACDVRCSSGDEPDPGNLMSYYTECRAHFSDDQVRLMQETVGLRRGWHPCQGARCPCALGGDACPVGMSCRPVAIQGQEELRCTLDGPVAAGLPCPSADSCGHDSVCLALQAGDQRCTRLCARSNSGCTCVDASDEFAICVEDVRSPPRVE